MGNIGALFVLEVAIGLFEDLAPHYRPILYGGYHHSWPSTSGGAMNSV